jgi:hypothetical protein
MRFKIMWALALATLLIGITSAHSWVEQMSVIDLNGSYVGQPGYPRGYVSRGQPGFGDAEMTVRFPAAGIRISAAEMVCSPAQSTVNSNNDNYPQLVTQPGNYVAMKYLENGHVTLPGNQIGKPGSGGLVYVYGTTNPANQKLLDVQQWTSNNTLDKGRLLAVNSFDDGRCYQVNPNSPMSVMRQEKFPDPVPGQPGSKTEQWCETNIQIPADAAAGTMTLYWVWQWPTQPGMDPNDQVGKDETYTTCADVNVVSSPAQVKAAVVPQKLLIQDPQLQANPAYKERAANTTLPLNNPSFYGPNNPNGASGTSANQGGAPVAPAAPSLPAPAPAGAGASPVTVTVTVTEKGGDCIGKTPVPGLPSGPVNGAGASSGHHHVTRVITALTTDEVTVTAAPSVLRRHARFFGDHD